MSNKNYCFDNKEAQNKSTYNKLNLRQNSNLIYRNEKDSRDYQMNNNFNQNNKTRQNSNFHERENIKTLFFNSLDEITNFNSFSPINKKPMKNSNEKQMNNINNNEKENFIIIDNKEKEEQSDQLVKQMIDNLSSNCKYFKSNNLLNNKTISKNNNFSLNLINNNKCFKKINNNISLNNNIIKTSTNKYSQINCQFNTNQINPTILKSSFIMAGIEKKNKNSHNNNNAESKFNCDVELRNLLNPSNADKNKLKENFSSSKIKSNDNYNCNRASKNNLAKISICNYDKSGNNNNNSNKSQKINTRSKSKNTSIYVLTNSQNEYLSKMPKTNKNRSISFNNLKYKSFSNNNNNMKRYNSGNFNRYISNKAGPSVNSYCSSLEKKNSLDMINKKYLTKILNESKTQSIIDIKKKYNEVYKNKYKKLPNSLIIKSNLLLNFFFLKFNL